MVRRSAGCLPEMLRAVPETLMKRSRAISWSVMLGLAASGCCEGRKTMKCSSITVRNSISPVQAQALAPQVEVEHAAARFVVIAEPRNDISVTVQHGPSRLPELAVRREAGRIIVDGGLARPFGGDALRCVGGLTNTFFPLFGRRVEHRRDDRAVLAQGFGRIDVVDLPVITAHVPLGARLATSGAVFGQVGPTHSLVLSPSGCGDWAAGHVQGALTISAAGSGDTRVDGAGEVHAHLAGSGDLAVGPVAGPADLSLAGSGDVSAGAVRGPVRLSLSGSGDVTVDQINAPVVANIASSGDVRIHGGRTPDLRVSIAGSGDFTFGGEAGQLAASVVGSGDVHVAHVDGSVSKSVIGSGEVYVGR